MRTGLITGLISAGLVILFTLAVRFGLAYYNIEITENNVLLFTLIGLIISIFLLMLIYIPNLSIRFVLLMSKEKLGIDKVYRNFEVAKRDIKKDFIASTRVSIFMQLGQGIMGGKYSLLFDEAMKRKGEPFTHRILSADKRSPHLSKNKAEDRRSKYSIWQNAIKYTEANIDSLKQDGVDIVSYTHTEPYLWSSFIFDQKMYLIPYLFEKKNHKKAPVLKLTAQDKKSPVLYSVFLKYFEDRWPLNKPTLDNNETSNSI